MNEYLKTTVERLNSQNYSTLHIVLGNESCDLDSAVSALVYAAFLDWQHQKMKCRVCTRNRRTEEVKDEIFVPILNVDREDYEIKTEVAHCLTLHGIEADHLVFRDDHSLRLLSTNANITLVDHHVLATCDQPLAPRVTEIIDHRPLAPRGGSAGGSYREDVRTTVELVGSCATLVAQRIKDLSSLFAKEADFFIGNLICTDLLHSTIILDTVNFSKEVDKGTPHDEEVVLFLETILQPADCIEDRAQKLSSLVSARGDVSRLSVCQLLRKDVKVVEDILVPSLPLLVQELISREGVVPALEASARRRGCAASVLLGVQLAAPPRRDVAVYAADAQHRDRICEFLQAWQPSFDLSEVTSELSDHPDQPSDRRDHSIRYFTQGNLSASRKQYMPALKEYSSNKTIS